MHTYEYCVNFLHIIVCNISVAFYIYIKNETIVKLLKQEHYFTKICIFQNKNEIITFLLLIFFI